MLKFSLFILLVTSTFSHAAIQFAFTASNEMTCADGLVPKITHLVLAMDVSCYEPSNQLMVNVSNSPLSEDPTEGVFIYDEDFTTCGSLTRSIPFKGLSGQVDLFRKMYARVTTFAEDYAPQINFATFVTTCD